MYIPDVLKMYIHFEQLCNCTIIKNIVLLEHSQLQGRSFWWNNSNIAFNDDNATLKK